MYLTHWGRENGRNFADDIFKRIFLNESKWISIKISLKFVLKSPFDNKSAHVPRQVIIWTNDGLVYWRIYASLGLNEIITIAYYMLYAWRSVVFGICFRKLPCCGIYIAKGFKICDQNLTFMGYGDDKRAANTSTVYLRMAQGSAIGLQWRHNSVISWQITGDLTVERSVQVSRKEGIKIRHYWSFVKGIQSEASQAEVVSMSSEYLTDDGDVAGMTRRSRVMCLRGGYYHGNGKIHIASRSKDAILSHVTLVILPPVTWTGRKRDDEVVPNS